MTGTGSWAWQGSGERRGQKSCHREKANLYADTNYATSRLGDDWTCLGSGEASGRAHTDLGTHNPGCSVSKEMRESLEGFPGPGKWQL